MTRPTGIQPIYSRPDELSKQVDVALMRGIQNQFPLENKDFRLELSNLVVTKRDFNHADEKEAILKSRSLTYPIKGDLRLIDKATGRVVDTLEGFPLADSFAITGKHTMMYKGNNYSVANLLQLKPGVYTRRKDDGMLESNFNTKSGRSFSLVLEPETQLIYMQIESSRVPVAPLISDVFNIADMRVQKFIPAELWRENLRAAEARKTHYINSLYTKLVPRRLQLPDGTRDAKLQSIRLALESSGLDPTTTKRTLGDSHDSVTADALLKALSNLIAVHRGDREEDNRDSLQFKRVQNLADAITRRFEPGKEHESVARSLSKLKFNLEKIDKNAPKIKDAVPAKPFNKVFTNFILQSPLAFTPSETNPIESLENVGKVTLMGKGEGGIPDDKSVPDAARNLDPSQLAIIDPSRTPESSSVGVDQRFTVNAHRDREGNLYAKVVDNQGKDHYLTPDQMMNSVIGFPGQDKSAKTVQAQDHGQIKEVSRSKVQFWVPDSTDMYTITTNLVPFLNSNHPGRLTMAGKAIPQALSLQDREEPLVQTIDGRGKAFVDKLGKFVSTTSPVTGTVVKSTSSEIQIKDDSGTLHKIPFVKNLPFNMKGFLDDEPTKFQIGDKVRKGQVLADNNYTKDGKLALGKNLYAAYMPYKGYNHEDGLVISETAAKKLNSLHSYKYDYYMKPDTVDKKEIFRRYFGNDFTPDQLNKLDDRGFIKKGSRIHYGDPIYAILEKKQATPEDKMLGKLNKILVNPYRKVVEIWEHEEPGEVVDVHTESRAIRILTRSVKPLEIGDKLTGLHGNKGVVSKILPDEEMPMSKDTGKAVDILLNPASVTSRINFGQVMETAASKIARKTGQPYFVKNYEKSSNISDIKKELEANGLSDQDEIIDPKTGKSLGKALAGDQYMLKLYKTTDQNYSARNIGKYDAYGQPSKGGGEGSKKVGYMEFLGLLGSDARKNLKEIGTVKSELNTDFWEAFAEGRPLPKPKQTFATKRLFDYLKASGVNTRFDGESIQAAPMTDHDILQLSNGRLDNPKFLNSRNLEPEKGGLFDNAITGGLAGDKWSHYELAEPIPHPLYERPIKSLLGLSKREFDGITSGAMGVHKHDVGNYTIVDTATGSILRELSLKAASKLSGFKKMAADLAKEEPLVSGAAFEIMLQDINVDKELKEAINTSLNDTAQARRNQAVERAKYLKGLQNTGLEAKDAYILRNMPVLPPSMRPVINKGDNQLEYADVNSFYKEHMLVNMPTKDLIKELPPEYLTQERAGLYKGIKATLGLGDALTGSSRGKNLKGLIKQIGGVGGPKTGMFHDKILSKKQDFSGRATIYAAPDIGFNEIKYPKDGLWTMYKLHIIRDLARIGYNHAEAKKAYEDKALPAINSFNKLIKEVPVIVNRAPTLMKTNLMAMFPVPVEGKTLGLNPLHLPGFAADYDGDAMSTYLPMTPEAIEEAKQKMLPSKHLSDARKGVGHPMFAPGHEAILGSVHLTEPDMTQKTVVFKTEKEALKALEKGEITVNTPIKIQG